LFGEPVASFENMPMVAQHLPTADTLDRDRGVDIDVFMCSGCGLVQIPSEPVPYYREVIRATGFSPEMKEFRTAQFGRFLQKHSLEGKKVLEVGCGRGEYLALLAGLGAKAYGLEYSREAVEQCRASGLEAFQGFVEGEDYAIPQSPFDAFAIFSFLEHLPQPNAVLRGIHRNLREGAVGIVEVPNFDMILRDSLFSEVMLDHLSYFTKETLGFVLRLNGFEVLNSDVVWHEYIHSVVVRKSRRLDLSRFSNQRERLQKEIDGYLGRFPRVAVWGAGHQAFAIMSMMQLAGKIRYVIDSAPFKQGKVTPATHIPIVAPETLRTDPVDAVIVMTGSYANEVKRILRGKFDPKLNIAVLRDFGLEVEGETAV